MIYEVHVNVDGLKNWDVYVLEVTKELDYKIQSMGYKTASDVFEFNEEGTIDLEDLLCTGIHYDPVPKWVQVTTATLFRKPLKDLVQKI